MAFWALFPAEHERQRALALHKHFVVRARGAHPLLSFHAWLLRRLRAAEKDASLDYGPNRGNCGVAFCHSESDEFGVMFTPS